MNPTFEYTYEALKKADESCANMPHDILISVERLSNALTDYGARRTVRSGEGERILGPEDFDYERHAPQRRHGLISARAGKDMVVDRERAHRQHIFLWRMSGPNMDYPKQGPANQTKQFCADVMMLATANAATSSGDYVGILSGGPLRTGKGASSQIFEQVHQLVDVHGVTPFNLRRVPRHSIAVIVTDALFTRPDDLERDLISMHQAGMSGFVIGVQHSDELEFPFKDHRKFIGLSGDLSVEFKKTERRRNAYLNKVAEHLDRVHEICGQNHFKFILQSTDRPLHYGLMPLFGMEPPEPAAINLPKRDGGPK